MKKWLADADVKKDDDNLDLLSITKSNIKPEDSISNVLSNGLKYKGRSSVHSKASSVFSVRLMEKAALLQSAAALRKMHDIDTEVDALQIEKAKTKKDELVVEAKLAAATATLSVFEKMKVVKMLMSMP